MWKAEYKFVMQNKQFYSFNILSVTFKLKINDRQLISSSPTPETKEGVILAR
jgi:hypothetical protein